MAQNITVCKFGGAAMADAEHIKQAIEIIKSDPSRRAIVVSAPGALDEGNPKITDLLVEFCRLRLSGAANNQIRCNFALANVTSRFFGLFEKFGCEHYKKRFASDRGNFWYDSTDHVVSRGEYWTARILAEALGYEFVDAREYIGVDENGGWRKTDESSNAVRCLKDILERNRGIVVPGFYGSDEEGFTKLFARNASDLSGAIVARMLHAGRYEIWKEHPVLLASPKIVPDATVVSHLYTDEAQELVDRGSEVVHPDAVKLASEFGIPIEVRALNDPVGPFTLISDEAPKITPESPHDPAPTIAGISSSRGMSLLSVKMPSMARAGVLSAVADIIAGYGISIEHIVDNKRVIGFAVSTEALEPNLIKLTEEIAQKFGAEAEVLVKRSKVLVSVVGRDVVGVPVIMHRTAGAAVSTQTSVDFMEQGTAGISIVISVDEIDARRFVQALAAAFA